MPSLKNHPHKYALDLYKLSLDKIPVTVPREIVDKAHADYEALCDNASASAESIEEAQIRLGRVVWPYVKAYDELYAKFGKEKENEAFLESLRADVKEHYLKWNRSGGLIFDIKRGAEFEQAFGPEEKFALEEAYLDAHEAARSYVDELVTGEKKAEYAAALRVWQEREIEMSKRIDTLRAMAQESEQWSAEILNKVKEFEAGFGVTERDPELYEIEKEIENYRGMLSVEMGVE